MNPDILELAVPYLDARAADLGLCLDPASRPALVTRRVVQGDCIVELRILGASHQVVVERAGVTVCSEAVACHTGAPPGRLPSRRQRRSAGAEHLFRSWVERLDPTSFRCRLDELLDGLAGATSAVCARFPGDELATTGLRLEAGGLDGDGRQGELSWSGWHSYPRSGEVVTTASHLVLRPPAGGGGR